MKSITIGPDSSKLIACPKCGQQYKPRDLGPVIIRCKKSSLASIIAPIESIQATQRAFLEHCATDYDTKTMEQDFKNVDGSMFEDNQIMPVAAMVCAFCAAALKESIDDEHLVSVTVPDRANGYIGTTVFSKALLEKSGIPTDKVDKTQ